MKKHPFDAALVAELYYNQGYTIKQLCNVTGNSNIYKHMVAHGFVIRKTNKPRKPQPSVAECAYAAGFFDGEGSISIRPPSRTCGYRLTVSVTQTLQGPLLWLRERWGGYLRQNPSNLKRGQSMAWTLQLSTQEALHFLSHIRPYLLVKAEEADVGMAFQQRKRNGRRLTADLIAQDRADKEHLTLLKQRSTV